METKYEVLNPWADVDQISLKGISSRQTALAGKTIGLFADYKRASQPILNVVEKNLKNKFPEAKFSRFVFEKCSAITEASDKARLADWAKDIDMAIAAVAD